MGKKIAGTPHSRNLRLGRIEAGVVLNTGTRALLLLVGLLVDVEVLDGVQYDVLGPGVLDTKIVQVINRDMFDVLGRIVAVQHKHRGQILQVDSRQQVGHTLGSQLSQ